MAAVQAGPNPALRLLGYLLTMFDKRLGIHLAYEATAPRDVRGRGLRRDVPAGQGLQGGGRGPAADQPLQAEVGRREGDARPSPTSCSARIEAPAPAAAERRVA